MSYNDGPKTRYVLNERNFVILALIQLECCSTQIVAYPSKNHITFSKYK